jgi:ADP-ribose pyrophosphatase YjhB (NUDIX family)
MRPKIRPTAVLIEDEEILLVEQHVAGSLPRAWSLPGGAVEHGETREETGLDIAVDRLLYVCDRIEGDEHVVHITFAVKRVGGRLTRGVEPEPCAHPIRSAKMVPLTSLCDYGFQHRFRELAEAGFPNSGTYQGPVSNIGL